LSTIRGSHALSRAKFGIDGATSDTN
jgi:hypothetical protein